ncbi:sugar ABC transporter permease [Paenibacillus sp. N1-5-1-14]|uniref:carbohydrate ABC transporter permease n=1 Tax=Paenibacillus radicibacter TaxID=2972488 RepID=UPI002158A8A2|nr:sugar ABC transporter permease [Paenibacillus radicibacter]MCR8643329.1 sugar ABC transporter permease [Paenibacillus radicibacter]
MFKSIRNRETVHFYIFIAPWIIGTLVFLLYPMIASLYYSFSEFKIGQAPKWIGLQNYVDLFHNDLFWQSVKATLRFTLFSVPLTLILSLLFAILLNQRIPFRGFFRTLMYFPSMISGVAMSLIWLWIFNPAVGMINYVLGLIGIEGPHWLLDENWAVYALVLMTLWSVGGGMVIFLAGLQNVPQTLYEVAKIDGVGRWKTFWKITFPMISPVVLFQLIMGIIESFQVFTQAYVMTRGGPHYSTSFYVYYIYQNAFANNKIGAASAMSWMLLVVVIALTYFIMKVSKKYVHYEGGEGL